MCTEHLLSSWGLKFWNEIGQRLFLWTLKRSFGCWDSRTFLGKKHYMRLSRLSRLEEGVGLHEALLGGRDNQELTHWSPQNPSVSSPLYYPARYYYITISELWPQLPAESCESFQQTLHLGGIWKHSITYTTGSIWVKPRYRYCASDYTNLLAWNQHQLDWEKSCYLSSISPKTGNENSVFNKSYRWLIPYELLNYNISHTKM